MTTPLEDRASRLEGEHDSMTTPLEDRVSRLEGAYEHLATKADVAYLRAEFKSDIGDLKVDLIKWMVTLMAGSVAATTSIVLLVLKLTG